ncbi:YhgE/Pip domain-containing protein [Neobacillus rhizophilus]|uniref:YhgE/Pip domain-containing protein n=1 Tax=Neobacillus rhizophilus TaxID=2833579 RepID=A0A942U305_9BACI|nr:YhgE/Pip domain-containing protein [Neobacillus rhizophilus]MBS4212300.1 YhgE/Pip domain-containing protein [Neobacillus rhizophilus]
MNKILKIFQDDIKSVMTNWAAALVIIALMFIPSLYAWFNIIASWDPYGNTGGIPIAVINEDNGTVLRGKKINIGEEVVKSLKQNKSLGWDFVDAKKADQGVKHGDYFASITIPKDFSKKIGTVLSDNPQKPVLIYVVNEKINAIAPKITAKGATGIKEQISKNFVKTANGVIFDIFNQLGIELQKNLPDIEKLKTMIFWLNDHLTEAENIINTSNQDADQAEKIVADLQVKINEVDSILGHAQELSEQLTTFFDSNKETFENLAPAVKQNLIFMEQTAADVEQVTGILLSNTANTKEKQSALNDGITRLTALIHAETLLINLLNQVNGLGTAPLFTGEIAQLNKQKDSAERLLNNLKTIQSLGTPSQDLLVRTNQIASDLSSGLGLLVNQYDSKIEPKFAQISDAAKQVPVKANEFFANADQTLLQIKKILQDAAAGIAIGKRDLALIKRDFPAVKQKITNLANQIREFEKTEDIRDIIDLLRNDVKKESDFFAEPVLLKEKRLFPIPNYGSAMSPFFTTLALWVGATLLISLIPVEVHDLPGTYHPNHVYLGRFLTFLTVALCQALIVTAGDILLLKTYVVDKTWFILFGLLISAIFMLITYTLVSIFGNVGKGLAIVFLVLQISGAGGTFPVQVMPSFFQKLHPFLPFTYAISLMREAVGGIEWDVAKHDLTILSMITVITLIFGLVLKGPIEKYGGTMQKKAKESRLIH